MLQQSFPWLVTSFRCCGRAHLSHPPGSQALRLGEPILRVLLWGFWRSRADSVKRKCPRKSSRKNRVSRCERVGFGDVDLEVLDGFLHHGGLNLAFAQQLVQRGQRDESRVDLEEVAQRFAVLAAAESVGAERSQPARHPW